MFLFLLKLLEILLDHSITPMVSAVERTRNEKKQECEIPVRDAQSKFNSL